MLLNLGGTVSERMEPEDALRFIEGVAGALGRLEESEGFGDAFDAPMLGAFAAILHDCAAVLALELHCAEYGGAGDVRRG